VVTSPPAEALKFGGSPMENMVETPKKMNKKEKEEMEADQVAMIRVISIVQKELEAHSDLDSKIKLNQTRERLKDIRMKHRKEMNRMELESEKA